MTDAEKAAQVEEDRLAQIVAEKEFSSGFSDTPVELNDEEKKISDTPVQPKEEDEPVVQETPMVAETLKVEETPKVENAAPVTNEQLLDLMKSAKSVDEVKALVQKIQDESRGRFGSLADQIKQIQAATSVGQAIEVNDEDFAELTKLVPDIAPKFVDGLKAVLKRVKGTGQPAPVETQEQFEERVKPVAMKIAREISAQDRLMENQETAKAKVAEKHPKWHETVRDTTFQSWLQEQPHAFVEKFNSSWEPSVVLDGLDKFYEAKKPKGETPKLVVKQDSRAQRLKEAMPPKGGASVPLGKKTLTPEEEFELGFKS